MVLNLSWRSVGCLRCLAFALLTAVTCAIAPIARAQSAPEGNAHPETQLLSESASGLASPFGDPVAGPVPKIVEKRGLADAVDLRPLRDAAVFHNGRVKILDTLSRETVRAITGRRSYQDLIPTGDGVDAVSYDPLFTMLDLVIDPAYYADKALIHVNYLPLRRLFVEHAFPDDAVLRDRWMKLQRISPRMVQDFGGQLVVEHEFEPAYRSAFESIGRAIRLWELSGSNLMVVAPASEDQPWTHLSSLPDVHPAREAARELGSAWRARDATRVNKAVEALAAELRAINPEVQSQGRRSLELAYNEARPFEWGLWLYASSLVTLLIAFGTGRRRLLRTGVVLLGLALALHAAGFVGRCILAERFAIQNQFESMTGLSLFAVLVGTVAMVVRRQPLFGAAAAAVGFMVLIAATQTAIPGEQIEREAAILNTSVLLKYHVTTVLTSYGLVSLGFVTSLFYLGAYYSSHLKVRKAEAPAYGEAEAVAALALGEEKPRTHARLLADLDTAQMIVLQLAFWTLGVGILLGAWWADHSWGRWWAFDPKETWALATWIIYLIVVHVRVAGSARKGLVTAWLSVAGFIVMLWTYFGVNLLLPGLHAYA